MKKISHFYAGLFGAMLLASYANLSAATAPSFGAWSTQITPNSSLCEPFFCSGCVTLVNAPGTSDQGDGFRQYIVRPPEDRIVQTLKVADQEKQTLSTFLDIDFLLDQTSQDAAYFLASQDDKAVYSYSSSDFSFSAAMALQDTPSQLVTSPLIHLGLVLSKTAKSITVFDVSTMTPVKTLPVDFTPSHAIILSGTPFHAIIASADDHLLRIFNLRNYHISTVDVGSVTSFINPNLDNSLLVLGSRDGKVTTLLLDETENAMTLSVLWTKNVVADGQVLSGLAISGDKKRVYLSITENISGNSILKTLSVADQSIAELIPTTNAYSRLYIGPDGSLLTGRLNNSSNVQVIPVFTTVDKNSFGGFLKTQKSGPTLLAINLSEGSLLSFSPCESRSIENLASINSPIPINPHILGPKPRKQIRVSSNSKNSKNFLGMEASLIEYSMQNTGTFPVSIDNIQLDDSLEMLSIDDTAGCSALPTLFTGDTCKLVINKAEHEQHSYEFGVDIVLNQGENSFRIDVTRQYFGTRIVTTIVEEEDRNTVAILEPSFFVEYNFSNVPIILDSLSVAEFQESNQNAADNPISPELIQESNEDAADNTQAPEKNRLETLQAGIGIVFLGILLLVTMLRFNTLVSRIKQH